MRLATMRRHAGVGLVALIAAAVLTVQSAWAENTLERARREGVIRIAYTNEEPFGFADDSGRVTGEAPEIARVIAKRLGIDRVEGVLVEWAALLPGLQAGRFDMVAAGMYIRPERCKQAAFTEPTYKIGEAFLVQAGNPKNLHSYKDVTNDPSTRLGVLSGGAEVQYARDEGIPDSQLVMLPDATSMFGAVKSGRVDAITLPTLSIQRMAEEGGSGVERAKPFTNPPQAVGYGAFALRKEDTALLEAMNRELAKFIGSEEHLELVKPFGFTEQELPDKTAAELCEGEM